MKGLEIKDLSISVGNRVIIHNLSVSFRDGQIYALVGRNGSGKSTLLNTIMGAPDYHLTTGGITLDGNNLADLTTNERAQHGLFLAMQYSVEVAGVSYADFLRVALTKLHQSKPNMAEVLTELQANARSLNFPDFDYHRDLNAGFSGGEKKKSEILQMLAIKPRFALLDEPDSGLDTDSVHKLADILSHLSYPTTLIITSHNRQLIDSLHPTAVYDMEKLQ